LSKIIKASQIIGKYKLSNEPNEEFAKSEEQKETDQKGKEEQEKVSEESKKEQSKNIIKEAEKKAEQIIQEAKAEKAKVEDIKKEAYQDGFAKGKEAGLQQANQKIQEVVNTLHHEIEQLNDQYDQEINQLQPTLINIATKMACKIINHKIEESPEIINNIVEDVLADLSNNHQQFVINVNPEILPYLSKSELKTNFPESKFEFNADDSLQKGDCVVNTNFGGKDAYLVEKLDRLEKQIKKEMGMNK